MFKTQILIKFDFLQYHIDLIKIYRYIFAITI